MNLTGMGKARQREMNGPNLTASDHEENTDVLILKIREAMSTSYRTEVRFEQGSGHS